MEILIIDTFRVIRLAGDDGNLTKESFIKILKSSDFFMKAFDKNKDGIVTEVSWGRSPPPKKKNGKIWEFFQVGTPHSKFPHFPVSSWERPLFGLHLNNEQNLMKMCSYFHFRCARYLYLSKIYILVKSQNILMDPYFYKNMDPFVYFGILL